MSNTGFSAAALFPAAALLAFSLAWSAGLMMSPRAGEPVAAVFPPWLSSRFALAAAAAADAQEIRGFGGWSTIVIARSDRPGFAARLRRAGALAVLRAPGVPDCMR